jgi:hypothetical protein
MTLIQKSKSSLISIAAALLTSGAVAQVVTVSQIPGFYPTGFGGGEFNISPTVGSGYGANVIVNNGFETFCVGRNVNIIVPGAYYDFVDPNGNYLIQDGSPVTKVLSKGSAWLYSQFAAGTLPDYDYTPGANREGDAYALQIAIWALEGSYGIDPSADKFLSAATNHFGSLAAAQAANDPGGFNVGSLNLFDINGDLTVGTPAQPMLVLLGTPPPPQTNNIAPGDAATIGFWHNKNGQALIKSMPNSPALGNWLSSNFGCLFGNLAGASDSAVASQFLSYFNVTGQKTYAQIMAVALATYVTDTNLSGTTIASNYGFNIGSPGTGGKSYNVGSLGTAIGLSNNTSYTVMQLLQQANFLCTQGFTQAELNALNTIFNDINTTGDIQ